MHIQQLQAGDLAAYRALHRAGLAEGSNAFVESLAEDSANPDQPIADMLARGEAWGGFIDHKLVAKMTIDTLGYATLAHTRWVHALYVSPEARGTGIAAAMVQTAIDRAKGEGATRFMLWVSDENAPARRFYEKLGFTEIGRVPGGIIIDGRAVDDVLMCLQTEARR